MKSLTWRERPAGCPSAGTGNGLAKCGQRGRRSTGQRRGSGPFDGDRAAGVAAHRRGRFACRRTGRSPPASIGCSCRANLLHHRRCRPGEPDPRGEPVSSPPTAAPLSSVRVRRGRPPGLPSARPDCPPVGRRPSSSSGMRPASCVTSPGRRRTGAGRAGSGRLRGRPVRHPALGRARPRAGRAGAVPGRQAGYRPADQGRLLLRLRRGATFTPEDLDRPREADAQDHQVAVSDSPGAWSDAEDEPGRAGRRAVQARADRPQGVAAH